MWSRERIEELLRTEDFKYHSVPLPHGLKTPGRDRSQSADAVLPKRLEGWSVLDFGAALGYFSFSAEERGAEDDDGDMSVLTNDTTPTKGRKGGGSVSSHSKTGTHKKTEEDYADYRGEGFKDGDSYQARIITKNISPQDGSDLNARYEESKIFTVKDGMLNIPVMQMNKFTAIEFVRVEAPAEQAEKAE